MRLHRLTLRDVKGVRERTVELPDRGVVVIEGPNEVGKTTLLEAFDALLSTKATSKAAGVRALQPVDRDVPPFVEAEFTVGGTRVVYTKQWLRQPSTTLRVLGPRPEQLTGDRAQQRVDDLLRTHLDRTLWDALRLTQSGDGTVAPLTSSTVLTEALDAAAGAHQHTDGADALLDAVETEYSTYFTPTGRPTGDLRAAMSRWTAAQDAVVEADRRVQEGAALLQRQQEAKAQVARAEEDLAVAAEELRAAQEAAAAAEQVAAEHALATERLTQARHLHDAATRAHEHRARAVRDLAAHEEQLRTLEADRDLGVAEAEALSERHRAAAAAAEEVRAEADEAQAEQDAARADVDLLQDAADLARRERLVEHVGDLVDRLREARAQVPAQQVGRPDARRARSLHDRLGEMLRQHDATSPVLHVESLGAAVEVTLARDAQGPDGAAGAVHPGEERRVALTGDATVDIPGQARLRVVLQEEAQHRVEQIAGVRAELEAALSDLGARDADDAERLADATEAAQAAVRGIVRDLEVALAQQPSALLAEATDSLEVPATLLTGVEELRGVVTETMSGRDESRALPADLVAARSVEQEVAARSAGLRTRARQAQAQVAESLTGIATLTARLERTHGRIQAETERHEALRDLLQQERDRRPDADLAGDVTDQAERVTDARQQHAETEAALQQADVEGARARLASARHRHDLVSRARESALNVLHTLGGQVEMAAGEGRQELHDLAVLELQEAERSLAAVDRQARAARHLRTALHRHRDAAHRAYVRPYTETLEALGRRVYGPGFAVVVDDQLALASRTLDGATVPFADLSGGAKEQLGILARLAVARLVDPAHGVPVVIDDALGYSDPQRLRQMGQVLGSTGVADDLQVILLTCTPERYSAIPDARTVRLSA